MNTFTDACKPGTKDFEQLVKKKMADALEESALDNSNHDVLWLITEVKVSLSTSFVDCYNSRDENGRFAPGKAPMFVMEPHTLLL